MMPTALLVDDEVRSLDAMRRTLDEDFTILTATDTDAARGLLERQEVDVTLCDQRMPGLTGVRELRNEIARALALGDGTRLHAAAFSRKRLAAASRPDAAPALWITAETDGPLVRLRVRDNGPSTRRASSTPSSRPSRSARATGSACRSAAASSSSTAAGRPPATTPRAVRSLSWSCRG